MVIGAKLAPGRELWETLMQLIGGRYYDYQVAFSARFATKWLLRRFEAGQFFLPRSKRCNEAMVCATVHCGYRVIPQRYSCCEFEVAHAKEVRGKQGDVERSIV